MALPFSVFARRLREARLHAGLSQKALGILVGIDPGTASPRMNQYERGKREPGLITQRAMALVLDAPLAFFYCDDDQLAAALLALHQLPARKRKAAINELAALVKKLAGG